MCVALQGSLLDSVDEVGLRSLGPAISRTTLTAGAWIDVRPGWLTGADELFSRLARDVPWQSERRQMYDRQVDVPRLLSFYDEADQLPDPVLVQARSALNAHYGRELGESFRTAGLCFYRDGRDSVAWHGDTIGRGSSEDTMVAIISVGAPRALLLRPRGGGSGESGSGEGSNGEGSNGDGAICAGDISAGRTIRRVLGHGDLIVMGGSCQRTWEHAIPKTSKPIGPRISIQFRPRGVR